jgi:hypothetical protein
MTQNQAEQKPKLSEKFRTYMIVYLDGAIRGLIAFLLVGLLLGSILIGVFHIGFIAVLIISFILGILISPLLSKIRLGERAINWYDNWLSGINEKINGK